MTCKQILLIDDDPDIQTVAYMSLKVSSDWQILTASSGKEGCQQAKTHLPDAILLDVMMPELDGPATLAILKADPLTQPIPIIFLTAKARALDRKKLYELGAQGVIHKPFDSTTLASQIAGFLSW